MFATLIIKEGQTLHFPIVDLDDRTEWGFDKYWGGEMTTDDDDAARILLQMAEEPNEKGKLIKLSDGREGKILIRDSILTACGVVVKFMGVGPLE